MPSESRAQHNYMEGVDHGDIPAPASTKKAAADFVRADTGRNLKALPEHVAADQHTARTLQRHHGMKGARVKHKKGGY